MNNYFIPVKLHDKDMAKKAEERLFALGGKWYTGKSPRDVMQGNIRALWLDHENGMKLMRYTDDTGSDKHIRDRIAQMNAITLSLGSNSEEEE